MQFVRIQCNNVYNYVFVLSGKCKGKICFRAAISFLFHLVEIWCSASLFTILQIIFLGKNAAAQQCLLVCVYEWKFWEECCSAARAQILEVICKFITCIHIYTNIYIYTYTYKYKYTYIYECQELAIFLESMLLLIFLGG